jgi:TrmH family RNA methyltransferase
MAKAPLQLTSSANPRIKAAVALRTAKGRAAQGRFGVEGAREIGRALRAGFRPEAVFQCPDALSPAAQALAAELSAAPECYEVPRSVFDRMVVREGSDGLLVIFAIRTRQLADLSLPAAPLVLAVQGIEKPGNLGALLRSADGAGADAIVVLDRPLDLFHPQVIRGSLGTVFGLPVVAASSAEFRDFCRQRGIAVHAAALVDRAVPYDAAHFREPTALLLGEEAHGLTEDWLANADVCVKIPMLGAADSLNVSVAGAILLYEARRQRSR